MVYGALGRIGVYHLQEIMRRLADAEADTTRLDLARRLLRQLPKTNWFARNPFVHDHVNSGDAGLYDLLLHSRDRTFTVTELTALISGAGLAVTTFIEPWRYDPASYLSDAALLKRLAPLDYSQRAHIAELLAGNLKVHICYVVKADRAESAVACLDEGAMVPLLRDGPGTAGDLRPGGMLSVRAEGLESRFALPRLAGPILGLIDGRRSVREIHADLAAGEGGRLDWTTFKSEFDRLYRVLNAVNKVFLVHPSTIP